MTLPSSFYVQVVTGCLVAALTIGPEKLHMTNQKCNISYVISGISVVLSEKWLFVTCKAVRASSVWSLSNTLCMSSCSLARAQIICSFRFCVTDPSVPQRSPSPPLPCCGPADPEPKAGDLDPDTLEKQLQYVQTTQTLCRSLTD